TSRSEPDVAVAVAHTQASARSVWPARPRTIPFNRPPPIVVRLLRRQTTPWRGHADPLVPRRWRQRALYETVRVSRREWPSTLGASVDRWDQPASWPPRCLA